MDQLDYPSLILLRHRASDARELQEKVFVDPDVLDELLNLAIRQIESRRPR